MSTRKKSIRKMGEKQLKQEEVRLTLRFFGSRFGDVEDFDRIRDIRKELRRRAVRTVKTLRRKRISRKERKRRASR